MQPCQGRPGWDTADYSIPEGTLKAGVLHPRFGPSWLHRPWGQRDRVGVLSQLQQPWDQDEGRKCSPTSQKNYFWLLPFLPSILISCTPAPFSWLLHSVQLGQDRNFPVAVETQMKDTLQTKMPNKKWLCVRPDGRFSLPGCGGFGALLWGTLCGWGGL